MQTTTIARAMMANLESLTVDELRSRVTELVRMVESLAYHAMMEYTKVRISAERTEAEHRKSAAATALMSQLEFDPAAMELLIDWVKESDWHVQTKDHLISILQNSSPRQVRRTSFVFPELRREDLRDLGEGFYEIYDIEDEEYDDWIDEDDEDNNDEEGDDDNEEEDEENQEA